MAASGAQYGISIVHYYWIGAVPAMIFLGVVMMPFYYGSKVRSVPEYLVRRYDSKTHLVNALIFVLSSVLIAGVNLYALAAVLECCSGSRCRRDRRVGVVRAVLHPARRADQRDLQRGDAVLRDPARAGPDRHRGAEGDRRASRASSASWPHGNRLHPSVVGSGLGGDNPFGDWIGIVFGLSFCLSFAYWTTNFAEVQRGMSAKDEASARLTPIVAAYPKVIIPFGTVIPGMAAILLIPGLGTAGGLTYNDAIPAL